MKHFLKKALAIVLGQTIGITLAIFIIWSIAKIFYHLK
jgi:hypothetical protein